MSGEDEDAKRIDVPSIGNDRWIGTPTVYVTASRDWLVEGYGRALVRFGEASVRDSETAKETFLPRFEALNCVYSIQDFEDKRGQRMDDRVSRALRFVRNRVHHDWAAAIEVRRFATTVLAERPAIIPPLSSGVGRPPTSFRQAETGRARRSTRNCSQASPCTNRLSSSRRCSSSAARTRRDGRLSSAVRSQTGGTV